MRAHPFWKGLIHMLFHLGRALDSRHGRVLLHHETWICDHHAAMWQLPPPTRALLLDEVRGVQTWMFINSSNDIYSHELINSHIFCSASFLSFNTINSHSSQTAKLAYPTHITSLGTPTATSQPLWSCPFTNFASGVHTVHDLSWLWFSSIMYVVLITS